MKRLFVYFASFFILLSSTALAKIPAQEFDKEFKHCLQERTSECFRILYSKSQNNLVRYNYAVMLYNEKDYDMARRVLRDFIYEDNEKHIDLVQNAKMMIKKIDDRHNEEVKSTAFDQGTYTGDIDDTIKWRNPNSIKVYITPSNDGKESLFRQAFQTWSNRLMMINFSYELYPDNADIICSFVDSYDSKDIVGLTESSGYLVNTVTGEKYFKPPVKITISKTDMIINRKFTDNELESVILHEIGHALGIVGHSKNKNDIMFYSTETYKNSQISNRDVNTIKAIYEKK